MDAIWSFHSKRFSNVIWSLALSGGHNIDTTYLFNALLHSVVVVVAVATNHTNFACTSDWRPDFELTKTVHIVASQLNVGTLCVLEDLHGRRP